MLKTYRIIPLVFILFLFGFTLFTVAPVFAADSAAFVECTQLKHPQRNFKQLLDKKDCFRDLARALATGGAVAQANGADSPEQVSTSGADDGMGDPNMPPPMGDPNMPLTSAQLSCTCTGCACDTGPYRKLHALTVELEAENARLLEQQGAPADPSGGEVAPLNANVAELETQVSAANAAFLGCTKINPEGYGTGLSRAVGGSDHATYVKAMKKQRDCFMSAAGL
jgi:hypothetical protein